METRRAAFYILPRLCCAGVEDGLRARRMPSASNEDEPLPMDASMEAARPRMMASWRRTMLLVIAVTVHNIPGAR